MNAPANFPATIQIYADLQSVLEKLQALDIGTVEDNNLVPMIKAIQSVGSLAGKLDIEINRRAVENKHPLPGVVVKEAVTHRKWEDPEDAAELAASELGDDAFEPRTLKSPAKIEKLGERGKAFVALASVKPPGVKRAVY